MRGKSRSDVLLGIAGLLVVVLAIGAAVLITGGADGRDAETDVSATSPLGTADDRFTGTDIIAEDVPAAPELPPGDDDGGGVGGASCSTGPNQRLVETYLKADGRFGSVVVDGRQSAQDCAAIKRFQSRYGIVPVAGYAGPLTGRVVNRLKASNFRGCGTPTVQTVCVDLTAQTMWVVKGNRRLLGPTTIRTGRKGLTTPAGFFRIQDKKVTTTSSYYHVTMPYWQRFYRDMGFHQTTTYLYDAASPGSHGCINLLPADARGLYSLTARNTPVKIFGRKPGT